MKYFNPSYWFKLWVLSAPLFNDKTQGINAKSIDNKKIKDWVSNNTSLESINQEINFTKSSNNYQPYNLNQVTNQNINPIYQTELETSTHKHRHQKNRNRYKRRPIPPSKEIFQLSEKLIINQNNPNQYRSSFQSILESLTNNNILRIVFDDSENRNWGENSRIFNLNAQNYGYFRLPIEIRGEQNGQSYARNLELVLRTDNLYVQGFIITERPREIDINYYYHFDFTNININMQPRNVQNGLVPLLTRIENFENIQLTGIRPDYVDLLPTNINNINWQSIFNSFLTLTNGINIFQERPLGNLAQALGQVIFVTAEAMRFPDIYSRIVTHLIRRNENINLQRNQRNEIYRILVSWGTNSRDSVFRWLLQIANTIQNTPNMMISPPSIVDFTRELNSPAVQVVLGYIEFQRIRNIGRNANCRRGKRELKNTYWHEKFCDLKPQIDKIQGKITTIKILDKNNESDNLKHGTIYIGTTNGVYMIDIVGQVNKFNGLNFPITDIKLDGNGSAYAINDKCEIYHLNLIGWGSEKLEHIESCDLNKELKLYYRNDHENDCISNGWYYGEKVGIHVTFNLGNINPINYKKIEILFDDSIYNTKITWGGDYYGGYEGQYYACLEQKKEAWGGENRDIWISNCNNEYKTTVLSALNNKKILENIVSNYFIKKDDKELIKSHTNYLVQDLPKTYWGDSYISGKQYFGLNWYPENYNYYFQFLFHQRVDFFDNHGGLTIMQIGKGIRLYNDDNTFETQIPNSNDRKRRDIISNTTKWTDEFTNSINNEQHLPITNNTNFVTNNITSL